MPSGMSQRLVRWSIVAALGVLVAMAIVAGVGSRTSTLRKLVIDTLADRLDSEVELGSLSVDTIPSVHITGTALVIRHKNRRDVPPLVAVESFTLDGGLFGLLSRPRRFRLVYGHRAALEHPAGRHQRRPRYLIAGFGAGRRQSRRIEEQTQRCRRARCDCRRPARCRERRPRVDPAPRRQGAEDLRCAAADDGAARQRRGDGLPRRPDESAAEGVDRHHWNVRPMAAGGPGEDGADRQVHLRQGRSLGR